MSKKFWVLPGVVLALGLAGYMALEERAASAQVQAAIEKLLTPADIEKVTRLQEVKLLPKQMPGNLKFATKDGTALLLVTVGDSSVYKQWRQQPGSFHASVSGVGDEAFEGPAGQAERSVLFFRKGNRAVFLSSFFDPKLTAQGKMTPFLTQEQLRELAKVIVSRL